MKFIYVMNATDKEKMIALGYTLIKGDERNNVYIFSNKDTVTFSDETDIEKAGIRHVMSNVIAF